MILYPRPPTPWRIRLLGLAIVTLLCWQLALSIPGVVHRQAKAPPPPAVNLTVGGLRYACTVPARPGPERGPAPSPHARYRP